MSTLQIINPTNHARFECLKPVTFTGKVDPGIVTVELKADEQYSLGSGQVKADDSWSITYSGFTNIGERKITAIGFEQGNQKKAETSIYINVVYATDGLDKIIEVAANSQIARYHWLDRGVAPKGYIKGMAVVYAKVYCQLKAANPFAKEMAKANTGNSDKDALAHYAQKFRDLGMNNSVAGVDTLRHLFVLLIGLGMRESSGKYCEGRDRSASNTTAETAEAGLFQTSYNARSASPLLPQLFEQYLANLSGFIEIFKEGVTCPPQDWENYGEGKGKEFQRLSKACPAFAAEFAAIGLRNLRKHWGPINRLEAEICPEADALLQQVQKIVDQLNLCPLF
ncbi:hypothetical protein IQ224_13565 [Microcystis sp. LEGE 00066]|uniref:Ig-like domain repeat protein n=2 Tax=Microcystis aeruginosa (strain PCC 7806) TaxID=267872 RepID=A8YBR5_MICA7|nr:MULTISPECIES: hypothetical protein [Microcystis]TRT95943.1 MAG: hypothetical protein EWV61_21365 [Microcystis aeruginosa Ma_AC_P_19900807_S300]ARI80956.1 hypothetical protein BH695_1675 [Microcystis aeruginosa PCC 7806SL]ELS49798.1 hypothetical protein C789_427 [Microcystis aeruginosa FACHB-905 = DIANCHI905]MBE9263158.1 hypothetical protein [Microcystis sp. LEGE 00066]UGS07648.1 hypothetical protein LRR78_15500 [Microcystis aeruginosa FACHB-905 = DIANCHI905]